MRISQSLFRRLTAPAVWRLLFLNLSITLLYWGMSHFVWVFFNKFGMLPAPIWPAAALALSAAFIFGRQVTVGIYVGAVLANWLSLQTLLPVALGIGVMNTLAPVLTAHLIRSHMHVNPPFRTVHDIFAFIFFGVLLHAALTATGGAGSLLFAGRAAPGMIAEIWLRWWLAHASGVVLLSPLLILIWHRPSLTLLHGRWSEFLLLFILSTALTIFIFFFLNNNLHFLISLPWLLLIVLVWCSTRFAQRETSVLLTTLLTISIAATVMGHGPFASHNNPLPMVSLGIMGLVFAFSALVLGAVSCERREEARQFRQLVERSPVAKLVYDIESRRILMANLVLEETFGTPTRTMDNLQDWLSQICPDEQQREQLAGHWYQLEQEARQEQGIPQIEIKLKNQRLESRYMRIFLVVIGSRYVATFNDLSEIKTFNEELEDRVRQRTDELRRSNEELRASLEQLHEAQNQLVEAEKMAALGRLVAGVAHEINTPVGIGVTAATHLQMKLQEHRATYEQGQLTRGAFEKLLNVAEESCSIIEANLAKAAGLIQSFKRVAVDQAHLEKRWFELSAYLEEVLHTLQPRLKSTPHLVYLNCPPDLKIYSYPGVFSQIISNFVLNSLKHGLDVDRAGQMKICVQLKEDELLLDYHDDGRGIAAEHLKHIFEPFFTTARGRGGTGLGLHIIYNLVTQTLGGQIECSSAPGRGVHFTVKLSLHNLREDSSKKLMPTPN